MNYNIENKTILITGASSGIGEACAKLFAKYNTRLILLARRKDKLEKLSKKIIEENNTDTLNLVVDITQQQEIDKAFSSLSKEWQTIDILINNAGLAIGRDKLQEGNIEDWKTMINTNIVGLLAVTNKVLPSMANQNQGHIVNVGSISSHEIYPGGAVYCATKHAERAITKGLKLDLTGTNVRVTSIDPGMVETEFSLVRFNDKEKAKQVYANMTPLNAIDVAEAILFAVTRPYHVNISEIQILPVDQSSTTLIHRR